MRNDTYTMPMSGDKGRLRELLLNGDNCICADCSTPDPIWASANIGVFICLKCSEVHRSLGSHVSKVLSVTLDEWTDEEIDCMVVVGGNSSANAIYEAFLPKGYLKPRPSSSIEERTKFIRSKYELQEFLKPSLRIVPLAPSASSLQNSDHMGDMDGSLSAESSRRTEGVVESIGMLNIKVVKGTNLAVRDMMSSDPSVVLILGQQRAQTTVVKSSLNPVWNEELKLSVPSNYGPLKVLVYDYDILSADDMMGEAEIDLQPLVNSATGFGNLELLGDMQIGKWLKTSDNALVHDSTINIVEGKVKQKAHLKLQNVESGEMELELEWISLDR